MGITTEGRIKQVCKKYNISFKEWVSNIENGLKWCYKCKTWKPLGNFSVDNSRYDGKKSKCQYCIRVKIRKVNKPPSFKGRKHSDEVRAKMSLINRKEKNPNWKGGITNLVAQIRNTKDYKEWRLNVYYNYQFTCNKCNVKKVGKNIILDADHIVPLAKIVYNNNIKSLEDALQCKEIFDIKNGRCLCRNCHKETDTWGVNVNRTDKMGSNTNIQWCDVTWNIARGCTKVDEDCKFCYMYRESMNGTRYEPKRVVKTKTVFTLPNKLKEPSKIFTSSLTDFFHEEIDSFRHEAWEIIRNNPQHTFQILTKRPERITAHLPSDWGEGWDNVWLGTSVGSQESDQRIMPLLMVKAKVRFLSIEPMHGPIDLTSIRHFNSNNELISLYQVLKPINNCGDSNRPAIDWVIVGGESGNENGQYKYRPAKMEWFEKIINDCKKAKVAVFVKQLGTHLAKELKLSDRHGGKIEEWPAQLQIREFPSPSPDNYGVFKGEVCNRNNCKGIIDEHPKERGCSCHINPPCSSCTEDRAYCPSCGWSGRDEQLEYFKK